MSDRPAKFTPETIDKVATRWRKEAARSGHEMTQEQAQRRVVAGLDRKQKRKER